MAYKISPATFIASTIHLTNLEIKMRLLNYEYNYELKSEHSVPGYAFLDLLASMEFLHYKSFGESFR